MDLIKNGNFTFPKILLFNYQELKINESQLILLIYLMNLKDTEFNPNNITKDLKMPLTDVLTNIDVLTNLNLIKIDLRKIDGVRHEFINIDQLYEKLLYLVIFHITSNGLIDLALLAKMVVVRQPYLKLFYNN